MKVQVLVRIKPVVLDVQGKAVEQAIRHLGFEQVDSVRVGKLIEFDVKADSAESARGIAAELCEKLLANTLIENYEVKLV